MKMFSLKLSDIILLISCFIIIFLLLNNKTNNNFDLNSYYKEKTEIESKIKSLELKQDSVSKVNNELFIKNETNKKNIENLKKNINFLKKEYDEKIENVTFISNDSAIVFLSSWIEE